jgi:putative ABC transport system permease protein
MLWNAFFLAVREMRRNVLRSFLTILGVIIGVASVITMVTIGNGATAKVTADIAKLGHNLLMVRVGQRRGFGGGGNVKPFTLDDLKAISRDISGLTAVAPSASQTLTAVFGNSNWVTSVTGTTNEFFIVRDWSIGQGRPFTDSELRAGRAVCLLGATVYRELFGRQDPLGSKVRLQKFSCEVIGLLEPKGQTSMGMDQDDVILIPLRTFQRRLSGNLNIQLIQISVEDVENTGKVQQNLELLFRERRHLGATDASDFSVTDMKEISDTLTATTKVLTALLGTVAAISLLVGGIGIMNIMLVSVTERTREIGTRLAIGALEREVLLQFLVEAIVLSSFGGILGIILALALAIGLSDMLQVPFIFDLSIILRAFLFSVAVGVFFGYFPARRAARLDPIEALRHE